MQKKEIDPGVWRKKKDKKVGVCTKSGNSGPRKTNTKGKKTGGGKKKQDTPAPSQSKTGAWQEKHKKGGLGGDKRNKEKAIKLQTTWRGR